jgi:hypothetical protein
MCLHSHSPLTLFYFLHLSLRQVLKLLAERGVPHEDRGGSIEVTLKPGHAR